MKHLLCVILLFFTLIVTSTQAAIAQAKNIELSSFTKEFQEEEWVYQENINPLNNLSEEEIGEYIENKIQSRLSKIESEINKYKTEEDWKEFSRQHFNTVKHIFDETRNSLVSLIQYSLIIISVVFGIAAFLIRGEFTNFKEAQERFRILSEELEKKNKELIELSKESEEIKEKFTIELEGISAYKDELKSEYQEVYNFLETEKKIKNRQVIWIFETDRLQDYGLCESLKKEGYKNIDKWQIESRDDQPEGSYSLIIYSYKGVNGSEENLKKIIEFTQKNNKELPMILFIYSEEEKIRISDADEALLRKYGKYSIVTTPSRFKAEFKTLIRG